MFKLAARLIPRIDERALGGFVAALKNGDVVLHGTPPSVYAGKLIGRDLPIIGSGRDDAWRNTAETKDRLRGTLLGAGIKLFDTPGIEGDIAPVSHVSHVGGGHGVVNELLGTNEFANRTGGVHHTPIRKWAPEDKLIALRMRDLDDGVALRAGERARAAAGSEHIKYDDGIYPHLFMRQNAARRGLDGVVRAQDAILAMRRRGCDPFTGVCSQLPVTSLAMELSGHSGAPIGEDSRQDRRLFEAERHISELMGLPVPTVLGANPPATPNAYRAAHNTGHLQIVGKYTPPTPTLTDLYAAATRPGTRTVRG